MSKHKETEHHAKSAKKSLKHSSKKSSETVSKATQMVIEKKVEEAVPKPKFYTEDGNWDLVGNNLPVFFIRDAIKFPDFKNRDSSE